MTDAVLAILFWGMLGMSLFVLVYPWHIHSRASRVLVHLPLVLLSVFIMYESLMPAEMNIRVDLLLLLPVSGVVSLCYVAKLIFLSKVRKSKLICRTS